MSEQPVLDAIMARRSIRQYQEKPVPHDLSLIHIYQKPS